MEKELLEILKSMQTDMKSIHREIRSMQGEMQSMHGEIEPMQNEMQSMNSKIDKNTLLLEEMKSKIETVAEVQENHRIMNAKQHNEIKDQMNEKFSIVELAINDTSKSVNEFKEKFDKVEKVTMQNTYDLTYLKLAK